MQALDTKMLRVALSLIFVGAFMIALAQDGAGIYEAQCSSCHQADGSGVEGVYPALAGSELLIGTPEVVIDLVLNGQGGMPAFANLLSDEEIAAVITHERSSWGNTAEAVTIEMVTAQRSAARGEMSGGAASGGSSAAVSLPDGWQEEASALFTDNCAACHQAEGQGVEGAFPALAGNAYVQSEPASVIATLLNGRGGMPSFSSLSEDEIAYLISHIRTTWGNEGSLVTPEMVSDVAEGRLSPSSPSDPNYRPGAAN